MVQEHVQYLPLNQIAVEQNVRTTFDDESLEGLLLSLKSVGQLQPIRVRKVGDRYVIVDGERRYRAARKLEMPTLAVIVEGKELGEGAVVLRQLVANVQREDLLPLEKAHAIRKLMAATQWNASETATRLGISNANVSRLLALLELPAEIQERVAAGEIPASAAYHLAKCHNPEQQADLAQQVASGKLTRDALVGARKAARRTQGDSPVSPVSRATAMLGINQSVTVAGRSLTLDDFIALLEECLTKARQSRTKGLALGTFLRMCKDTAHAS